MQKQIGHCKAQRWYSASSEILTFADRPTGLVETYEQHEILGSYSVSHDSKVLQLTLGARLESMKLAGLPAGVKIKEIVDGIEMDKSYSPITLPDQRGMDLHETLFCDL